MSLGALRKLRAQAVEDLMMELAQVTKALTESEARYRDMEASMHQDAATYDRQTSQGLTIEALLEWQGRMDAQQATLQRIRHEIDRAAEAWQHTKARLVEASQERKLLDLVADKRQAAQRADAARLDQRTTDEVASRRYETKKERRS